MNPSVSIVIPTRDMRDDLELLLQSLQSSGVAELVSEIIIVDDGSKDGTAEFLNSQTKVKTIRLQPAEGRFYARQKGALAATGDLVFFVDTRVQLTANFGANMKTQLRKHRSLMGVPFIDSAKSIYNLYWLRTHQVFFKKHFTDAAKGFFLTPENFKDYTKGTGALIVDRKVFLEICAKVSVDEAKYSDDTFVLQTYVDYSPIYVTMECSYTWEPRQNFAPFMERIFERGQNFAYNHWLAERTRFTAMSLAGMVFAILIFIGFISATGSFVVAFAMIIATFALSTVLFTRSPKEIFQLIPLQILCLIIFGVGALYGLSGVFRRST